MTKETELHRLVYGKKNVVVQWLQESILGILNELGELKLVNEGFSQSH